MKLWHQEDKEQKRKELINTTINRVIFSIVAGVMLFVMLFVISGFVFGKSTDEGQKRDDRSVSEEDYLYYLIW